MAEITNFTTPAFTGGCWTNSESTVAFCCTKFGGSRSPLQDSPIGACLYNETTGFLPQNQASMMNISQSWSACVKDNFNATDAGTPSRITECVAPDDKSTSSSGSSGAPSSTGVTPPTPSPSGAGTRTVNGEFGRVFMAAILAGGGLLHVVISAI
ncbi:hypothetical protein C8R43DRAFT_168145 [Mycena crocata]|nr:hypothetical protein C8R43DRAFT_168145 [Mycena crocata]